MTESEIYEQYGRLLIQQELLQSQIMQLKGQIAQFLNKPQITTEQKGE